MSRKKFGAAAAAFAESAGAESLADAEVLAPAETLAVAEAPTGAESLAAGDDCADATVATVVRANIRPSAADRCRRSKGPPGDVSACRSRAAAVGETVGGLAPGLSDGRRVECLATHFVGSNGRQRRVVLLAGANAN